jgi:hypothetical protein
VILSLDNLPVNFELSAFNYPMPQLLNDLWSYALGALRSGAFGFKFRIPKSAVLDPGN